jgi:hypothetical protein
VYYEACLPAIDAASNHINPAKHNEDKAALDRLRTLMKDEQFAEDEQAKGLLAEAEKLIEGKE